MRAGSHTRARRNGMTKCCFKIDVGRPFQGRLGDAESLALQIWNRALAAIAAAAALCRVRPPAGRAPSMEDMFVATTAAAEEAEGAMCTMPEADARAAAPGAGVEQQIAIPTRSDAEGGDLPPVRMVVDPYPSFNGVAVDTTNDLVMMSDTNRKSLLVYDRAAGSATSKQAAAAKQQIMGPDTGVGFVAGVAMDPVHRELFTVNNDVEDRLVAVDYDARGHGAPQRLPYVPPPPGGVAVPPEAAGVGPP